MRLPPNPPRPICMSRAAVANGALGRTSSITTLPLLHTLFLNELELICLHTVKWCQVLLLKIKQGCILVCPKSNLMNMVRTIINVPRFDITNWLIWLGLSNQPSSPIRAKVECFRSCDHCDNWGTDFSATKILWIELPWPENPLNTYAQYTGTLDSCFDLIRSHQ